MKQIKDEAITEKYSIMIEQLKLEIQHIEEEGGMEKKNKDKDDDLPNAEDIFDSDKQIPDKPAIPVEKKKKKEALEDIKKKELEK